MRRLDWLLVALWLTAHAGLIYTIFFQGPAYTGPGCDLHEYVVIRFNPSQDALLRPSRMDGANPTMITTKVMACSYTMPHPEQAIFHTGEVHDAIGGIIHILDQGKLGQQGKPLENITNE